MYTLVDSPDLPPTQGHEARLHDLQVSVFLLTAVLGGVLFTAAASVCIRRRGRGVERSSRPRRRLPW